MYLLPQELFKYFSLLVASFWDKQPSQYTNLNGILFFVDSTSPLLCCLIRRLISELNPT